MIDWLLCLIGLHDWLPVAPHDDMQVCSRCARIEWQP